MTTQIRIDLKENNCRFEQCRHFDNGKCLNDDARKMCLEIAFAVLCIDTEINNERISSEDEC